MGGGAFKRWALACGAAGVAGEGGATKVATARSGAGGWPASQLASWPAAAAARREKKINNEKT